MTEEVLRFSEVTKRFGSKVALDRVDLTIKPGCVTVLLGANGAGKSTMLRAALAMVRPQSGHLIVLGSDPVLEPDAVRRRVGYVPDVPDAPPWMNIGQLCRFTRAHYPAWDDASVTEWIDAFGVPRRTPLGGMSRGEGMKAMLILALASNPELLLLDEPFGGLDPLVRDDVLRAVIGALRGAERTVVCATHELEIAARIADRVAIVADGRIANHGTLAEVVAVGTDEVDEPLNIPHGLLASLAAATACRETEVVSC